MLVNRILKLTLLCALCNTVQSARVLAIFAMAAPSHYILGNSLLRGIAEAGHNVTMISPHEEKNPPKRGSYKDVVLTGLLEDYYYLQDHIDFLNNKNKTIVDQFAFIRYMIKLMNEKFLTHKNVLNLIKSGEKFDVVIVEQFMNDVMKVCGRVFNAPVIVFSPLPPNPWINNVVGNPTALSYIPVFDNDAKLPMNFWERLTNVFMYIINEAIGLFFYFPDQNRILKKYFPDAPDIKYIYHDVQLVLLISHESLNDPAPYVPNMIQIGGYHVKPSKKLPKDLQEYLDSAKDGVVYFSLGSNVRSKDLSSVKRNAFLTAFGKLKQKVLWKWEGDELPGKPDNVKVAKWLPQQDILAHPNVKLFITHSGLLSITETVYHGVPILAIPVSGDQYTNARLAVSNGYALALPYKDPSFSEEKLSKLLQELLTNPKYTENAKTRSKLFHDRPMKPMETAVYWVEYIARHGGAPHLRVAGVDFPWYKYHSLDVISFLVIVSLLATYVTFIIVRRILRCRSASKRGQTKLKGN